MKSPTVPLNTIPLDAPFWWPDRTPVDEPQVVSGFICPATFTVTGLPVPVTFGTGIVYAPGPPPTGKVTIGHLTVDTSTSVPKSLDLPLEALTRAAVRASTARGVLLPKNYKAFTWNLSDPSTWVRAEADQPLPTGMSMIVTDDLPVPWPIHVGPISSDEEATLVARVTGLSRPRRTAITDDVLRETADVYRSAESDPRLAVATYFHVSPSTARQRIRKARERGFLEDVPDTDGRKARRKGKP